MKLVKSLLLGSAAGLMAVAGAQAADLPSRKAAPAAEYVRVCSAYGAGFFFIPGSDTCLQLSGRVRAQYQFASQRDAQSSTVGFRALLRMGMDARTQTEYGTVRAVARITAERRTGAGNTGTGSRAATVINSTQTEIGSFSGLQTQINVDAAFIQFAGITAGRAPSFFNDIMAVDDFHGLHYSGLGSGATNLLAYTASFGGGFSATLSLEDSLERRITASNIAVNAAGLGAGAVALGGIVRTSRSVDVVGNLRLDQAWGSIGVSGALVPHTFGNSALGNGIAPGDELGYALAAATKINLPFLTPGSNFQLTGAYGVGANSYVWGNAWHQTSNGNGAAAAVGQRLNLSGSDVVLAVGPTGIVSTELTKSWSVAGALQVFWTPRLRSTFGASYAQADFSNRFYNPAVAAIAGSALGRDYGVYSIMGNLIWSPVRAMDIGVEVLYSQANVKGVPVQDATTTIARLTKKDDQFVARVRIQRDF